MQLRKANDIDVDKIGDELILMHVVSRKVVVLNDAGHLVWDALDLVDTREELHALLLEGAPHLSASDLEQGTEAVLAALLDAGIVIEAEAA